MAKQTAIDWTDSTFNPWIGCTKVSPACDNCYAAVSTPVRAMKIEWGPGKPRHRTSASNWRQPIAWERAHAKFFADHARRRRVFCASLADVFDNEVPVEWRAAMFALMLDTPHLDWLLLTKRIGNVERMVHWSWMAQWPENVWLGITVVNQEEADRDIPKLLAVPAAVRFLSIEPMLGPVDLESVEWPNKGGHRVDVLRGGYWNKQGWLGLGPSANLGESRGGFTNHADMSTVDWVICGGESGRNARPIQAEWVESLREQCAGAGVPFFFKQWGGLRTESNGCALNGAEVKQWPHNTKVIESNQC